MINELITSCKLWRSANTMTDGQGREIEMLGVPLVELQRGEGIKRGKEVGTVGHYCCCCHALIPFSICTTVWNPQLPISADGKVKNQDTKLIKESVIFLHNICRILENYLHKKYLWQKQQKSFKNSQKNLSIWRFETVVSKIQRRRVQIICHPVLESGKFATLFFGDGDWCYNDELFWNKIQYLLMVQ